MKKPIITEFVVEQIIENSDLKKLLPPVDEVAREQLKALIEAEGIREPLSLAVIEGQNVLLDGHNRLRVAKELGYVTIPAVFYDDITDIIQAEIWMVHNQLARRNMSDMERIQVILKLEPELKEQAKARQRGEVPNSAQVGKVVQILADMADVSRNTISQAKAILATGDAELIAITDREVSFNKAFKYASLPAEDRQTKIQEAVRKAQAKEAKQALPKEEKPAKVKPENNREFSTGFVRVQDNILFLALDSNYTGKNGNIKLANSEEANIDTMIKTSNFYAKLSADLRTAAQFYKTPEAKPPKAPTAKQLARANTEKMELEALLKTNNYVEDEDIEKIKASALSHKDLIKALKKAIKKADIREFNDREDAIKFNVIEAKYNLTEEQKDTISNSVYYPDEKTFKLRFKDHFTALEKAVEANKEAKNTTPAPTSETPTEAPEPQAVASSKKKSAAATPKVKAPAKATAKNTGKSGALSKAVDELKKDTKAPKKAKK
jgi:ParB-like chromosome segregation protein Spo0J